MDDFPDAIVKVMCESLDADAEHTIIMSPVLEMK